MTSTSHHSPFATSADDRIDTLGEVKLLARIRVWLGEASPPTPEGIGDDCAVWPAPPAGEQLLFTTDAVVYSKHFDAACPPELAAEKLLKRNLSDIAAMGGSPHSALLALTLPRNLSLRWLERFYLGLRKCSLRYQTPVTGGDITEGTDNFFAAHITLIGHAQRPLLRSGAQAGDHLFVTGALGGSIHGHHLHFEPRLAAGRWLAAQPDVCAMIDLTDGLAKDLPELLPSAADTASHTSPPQAPAPITVALLDLAALPLRPMPHSDTRHAHALGEMPEATASQAANPIQPSSPHHNKLSPAQSHALFDGEDYELLFAVDAQTDPTEFIARWQRHFGKIQAPAASTPANPAHADNPQATPRFSDQIAPEFPNQAVVESPGQTATSIATSPQTAYPYCIGKIALVDNHPPNVLRLYDAATQQPLKIEGSGFEHLKS